MDEFAARTFKVLIGGKCPIFEPRIYRSFLVHYAVIHHPGSAKKEPQKKENSLKTLVVVGQYCIAPVNKSV